MNDAISLVSGILMMILILLMAYGVSRFLGKQWRSLGRGKYLEVVDRLVVGQDRELLIIRLEQEDKCILVGSGADGLRLITELSDRYPRTVNRGVQTNPFQESLRDVMNQWKSRSKGDSSFDFAVPTSGEEGQQMEEEKEADHE